MQVFVRFGLQDGREVNLGHGGLIGRLGAAALCLEDPSVSEAHAMVSLRGHELMLLGLRGRFIVDTKPISKVVLRRGQTIRLSRRTTLTVLECTVPSRVIALSSPEIGRQVLSGVCSWVMDNSGSQSGPRLVPRFEPNAAAWFFSVDGAWRYQLPNGEPERLKAGQNLVVGPHTLRVEMVDLTLAGQDPTSDEHALAMPLKIVARYESVHIHRPSEPVLVLTGIGARIISELVSTDVPTPWETLAREVWNDRDASAPDLRARFDAAMLRLRRKLRLVGLRPDLVRTDGHGSVELVVQPGDILVDEG